MIPLSGGDDSSKLHLARSLRYKFTSILYTDGHIDGHKYTRMDRICDELTVEIKFY